jgi:hypothetical protein
MVCCMNTISAKTQEIYTYYEPCTQDINHISRKNATQFEYLLSLKI